LIAVLSFLTFLNDNPTTKAKVTIEPSVPETTSISLDSNLQILALFDLGYGLELQARAICVGSNDIECTRRSVLFNEAIQVSKL